MRYSRGLTAMEILLIVAGIAIVAVILVDRYRRHELPVVKVSRSASDMRSMATALEAYFIDHGAYPAMTTDVNYSLDYTAYPDPKPSTVFRTFRTPTRDAATGEVLATLTTPVAYIIQYPSDYFRKPDGPGYMYFTDGPGWILSSVGPNGIDDMGFGNLEAKSVDGTIRVAEPRRNDIEAIYDSSVSHPSPELLTGSAPRPDFLPKPPAGTVAFTYDPTNGSASDGNIYRVSQRVDTYPVSKPETGGSTYTYDPTNGTISRSTLYRVSPKGSPSDDIPTPTPAVYDPTNGIIGSSIPWGVKQ